MILRCFILFYLFIWGLRYYQHFTGHITTGSWKSRGNQHMQFVRVLYCKLPANLIPAFPFQTLPGTKPRNQRWEASVLPLCHHGPFLCRFQHCTGHIMTGGWKVRKPVLCMLCIVYLDSAQYLHILQDSKRNFNQSDCTSTAPTHK